MDSKTLRQYTGIEPGLQEANREFISVNKKEAARAIVTVSKVIDEILNAMKEQYPVFKKLFMRKFGGGSSFDGTKVGTPQEFDIHVLLELPEETRPEILKYNHAAAPAHVMLKLRNFGILEGTNPLLYNELRKFGIVDEQDFLKTDRFKAFIESIFTRTINTQFPNGVKYKRRTYKIERVQEIGPARTLRLVRGQDFVVSIDFVPGLLFNGAAHWPQYFRSNPFPKVEEQFFLVAKRPKNKNIPNVDRYWLLSFQIQERKMIHNLVYLKPTLKVIKAVRDHYQHDVSSYALKTIFLWELRVDETPDQIANKRPKLLWTYPFSYCVVHMLQRYADYLKYGRIDYFWNAGYNLIDINETERNKYITNIENMLNDIKRNPCRDTIIKYFKDTRVLNQY